MLNNEYFENLENDMLKKIKVFSESELESRLKDTADLLLNKEIENFNDIAFRNFFTKYTEYTLVNFGPMSESENVFNEEIHTNLIMLFLKIIIKNGYSIQLVSPFIQNFSKKSEVMFGKIFVGDKAQFVEFNSNNLDLDILKTVINYNLKNQMHFRIMIINSKFST